MQKMHSPTCTNIYIYILTYIIYLYMSACKNTIFLMPKVAPSPFPCITSNVNKLRVAAQKCIQGYFYTNIYIETYKTTKYILSYIAIHFFRNSYFERLAPATKSSTLNAKHAACNFALKALKALFILYGPNERNYQLIGSHTGI